MKKPFILLSIVLLCNTLTAQEYQYTPMPTADVVWNVFYRPPASNKCDDRAYTIAGDTLINNELWSKIVLSGITIPMDIWGNILGDGSSYGPLYQGAYQEINKVVRFCSPDGTIDTLYDFNLNVGDTIKFLHVKGVWCYDPDSLLIVEQIDSILIQNHYRKCFIFKFIMMDGGYGHLTEKWIEGIGSIHGILFPLNIRTFYDEASEEEDLTCFFENNELLWKHQFYKSCSVLAVQDFTLNDKVEIYPNPASQVFYIKIPDELRNSLSKIELFDVVGNRVLTQSSNNYPINIAHIKSGIYFVVIYMGEREIIKKLIIY